MIKISNLKVSVLRSPNFEFDFKNEFMQLRKLTESNGVCVQYQHLDELIEALQEIRKNMRPRLVNEECCREVVE